MTKKVEISQDLQQIAQFAKAMSHPVRVYILKKLSSRNSCCYSGDLVDELPIGRSALSQHLKELKHAGLIQGEIEAPFIKYCLNRENWEKLQFAFSEYFTSEVEEISLKL
jgi:ArsR family transcriptional regulator, arsenate/arsenite/antimonite-responsive transcriptional repressor